MEPHPFLCPDALLHIVILYNNSDVYLSISVIIYNYQVVALPKYDGYYDINRKIFKLFRINRISLSGIPDLPNLIEQVLIKLLSGFRQALSANRNIYSAAQGEAAQMCVNSGDIHQIDRKAPMAAEKEALIESCHQFLKFAVIANL